MFYSFFNYERSNLTLNIFGIKNPKIIWKSFLNKKMIKYWDSILLRSIFNKSFFKNVLKKSVSFVQPQGRFKENFTKN